MQWKSQWLGAHQNGPPSAFGPSLLADVPVVCFSRSLTAQSPLVPGIPLCEKLHHGRNLKVANMFMLAVFLFSFLFFVFCFPALLPNGKSNEHGARKTVVTQPPASWEMTTPVTLGGSPEASPMKGAARRVSTLHLDVISDIDSIRILSVLKSDLYLN